MSDRPSRPDQDFTVVGGGTGALGRAVVDRLLGEGRRIIVPARSVDAELPAAVTLIKCDISVAADVERFETEVAGLGTWNALVNASGGFAAGKAHTTSDAKMLQQLELNFLGQWRLARAAARAMTAGGGGRIVNVVGRAGVDPAPGQAAYQVAKAALARLTQVMALELVDEGITVNAVLPSTMDTPKNRAAFGSADTSRWVPVADVAAAIAWLLSDEAAIVNGALLPVYGRA
jgi:NAD(P)-dependent dehydrogenase (short-subunit alcohol dehydrogenase family)